MNKRANIYKNFLESFKEKNKQNNFLMAIAEFSKKNNMTANDILQFYNVYKEVKNDNK